MENARTKSFAKLYFVTDTIEPPVSITYHYIYAWMTLQKDTRKEFNKNIETI